jgi:hypothetical protein
LTKIGHIFTKTNFFCKLSEKVKKSNQSGILEKERKRKKKGEILPPQTKIAWFDISKTPLTLNDAGFLEEFFGRNEVCLIRFSFKLISNNL